MQSRVAELRTSRGLTQEELGRVVGVSRQTVNAIEKERFNPSLGLAFRLSRLFELAIEDIFSEPASSVSSSTML